MTVLPLVVAPDPRLNQKSAPVEKVDDSIRALVQDMLETMYASNGIGLAAVQVGVHKRILVMDVEHGSDRYPDTEASEGKSTPLVLINPEIVESSAEQNVYEEGCLSFPGQYAKVERPKRVTVRYLDTQGKEQHLHADGLLATCVQHEMDHLNGVVFVDHISQLKRGMLMRKLAKQQRKS